MKFMGKTLIIGGLLLILAGLFFIFKDQFPLLKYFGQLPGDIRVEKPNFRFYFPITSMVILSVVISFLIYLYQKLFH